MPGFEITRQSASLDAALSRLLRRLQNIAPTMSAGSAALRKNIDKRFDTKTDPWGRRWKRWSEYTAAIRAAERERGIFPNATLMVHSGEMRRSLDQAVSGARAEVGFQVDYAEPHEKGVKKQNLPARPLMFGPGKNLNEPDTEAFLEGVMESLKRVLYRG